MEAPLNPIGQPVGPDLPGWSPPPRPPRDVIQGCYCRLEPGDPERHAPDLFQAFAEDLARDVASVAARH